MRQLFLVVNPTAQGVSARRTSAVIDALETSFAVRIAQTKGPRHAEELASEAVRDGVDMVVAFGGDGTVNEVANSLATTEIPFSVVPGGGANVFARSIGLPWGAVAAAERLADPEAPVPRRLPLGRIDDRYFAANCGMGFDAAIVRSVERHPKIKRAFGDWFFVWAGLLLFFGRGFDRRRPRIELCSGDDPGIWRHGLYLAIVQNVDPFTYLGKRPLRLCPDVSFSSGLDCFAVDSMRSRHILSILIRAFGKAGHLELPHTIGLHGQRSICLRADAPMPVQADGEYLGDRREVEVHSVPNALTVLV